MQQVSNIKEIKTAINQNKEIGKHLLEAEEDIENGRYKNAREAFNEWKEKYGI